MPAADPLHHLQATTHRLARGLWFAYAAELVDDVAQINAGDTEAWLQDAADLLLSGDFDHLTNLDGATELARLRTLIHATAATLLCAAPPAP